MYDVAKTILGKGSQSSSKLVHNHLSLLARKIKKKSVIQELRRTKDPLFKEPEKTLVKMLLCILAMISSSFKRV